MSSWIKIERSQIVRYSDGPHNLSIIDGWREVPFPAMQWKLDALGRVIKKSRIDMDTDAEPRIRAEAEDRQRIGGKIDTALVAFEAGDHRPLRKLLTRIVLRFKDLEKELN